MPSVRDLRGASLGALVFAALMVLAVGAFTIERAARSSDDLVNTVVLSPTLGVGGAEVEFTLAEADPDVDVLIIDGNEGSDGDTIAVLARDEDLAAGRHVYEWDGKTADGVQAPPGLYALKVVLGEADREIEPPGRIEIPENAESPAIGG